MGMKIFYHPQNDKLLEYYYCRCGGGWSRKCLQLGKVALDGGGLRAFALGPSAQPADSCHIQVLTPMLPSFMPQSLSLSLPCLHLPPHPVLFSSKFSSTKMVWLVSLFVYLPLLELCNVVRRRVWPVSLAPSFLSSEPRVEPGT